jgi:hypothetical protein
MPVAFGCQQTDRASKCDGSTVEDFSASLAPKARSFLAGLKAAVQVANKEKVAAMVQYPLRVNLTKGNRTVRTAAEFVKDYDSLFTPAVRKAIETQVPECLFANYQGVMIGRGEVWFQEQQDGALRIKALNP